MLYDFANIPTSILNDDCWAEKPFTKGQAKVDIFLLSANESSGFERSEIQLADRWGWSRGKVRAFLDALEESGEISPRKSLKKAQKKTVIKPVFSTVCENSQPEKSPKKAQEKAQSLTPANATIQYNKNEPSNLETYKRIVKYFNDKCNKDYRYSNDNMRKYISERYNEGFREEHFYTVIDKKADEWLGDAKMEKYLRPSTLFSKEHFEDYLNQRVRKRTEDINASRQSQLAYLLNDIKENEGE